MRKFLAVFIALFAGAVLADHHGRGKEATDGFPGVYDIGAGTMTFTGDGYLITVMNRSNVAIFVGKYEVEGDVLSVVDVSPPAFFNEEAKHCATENTATYRMVDDPESGGTRVEPISEACPQRAGLWARTIMQPYQRPDS